MLLPDTLILGVLMLINLISLGGFALWIRIYIEQALMDIDEKLAMAIQALVDKLMSGGLAEFEPPNPIQGAIAQLIQGMAHQKMNTFDANITQRGPDGQFTSATDLERSYISEFFLNARYATQKESKTPKIAQDNEPD